MRTAKQTPARTVQSGTATRPGSDPSVAIPVLLKLHGPRLHALALRLCGHREDAADMVQGLFMQAFRKWHTFKGDADPGTWLYAIAARSCKSRFRRRGGIDRRMPAVSQLMPWGESTVMKLAASKAGTQSDAERREAIELVQAAIARLPEHLRLPVVMKEVLELSVEETASALGLATNTVKTRLHRARLALRKAMTSKAAGVAAPAPIYEKQVCLDLLKAKMETMDRGGVAAGFAVPQAEVCARCRAVFREFDLVQDACAQMGRGDLPPALRASILDAIRTRDGVDNAPARKPQRGRRPVARSKSVRSKATASRSP